MSILDLILFGFLAFVLVRFIRRRFGGGQDQSDRQERSKQYTDENGEPRKPNRHDVARATWDMLSSGESSTPTGPATRAEVDPKVDTAGFDPVEFLEGAKLFFTRLYQARDAGTVEELKDFLSPTLFEELQAAADKTDGVLQEVMLLDARLAERKTENGRTIIAVMFDATIRKGVSGETPYNYRGVWEFTRNDDTPGALWTLDRMDRVDH